MTQTALVTGAGVRLGRVLARAVAERGYRVAVHFNRSREGAERTAEEIRAAGGECALFQADFGDDAAVMALPGRVEAELGGLSLLVNSASVYAPGTLAETTPERLDEQMRINFRAPLLLIRAFAALGNAGQVVNIADAKASFNQYPFAAYILSKRALLDLTRLASLELAPRIRVNAISPGVVLPPEDRPPEYLEWRRQALPLERLGDPRHVVSALGFLLENDFVTGVCLPVDGGETQATEGRNVDRFRRG